VTSVRIEHGWLHLCHRDSLIKASKFDTRLATKEYLPLIRILDLAWSVFRVCKLANSKMVQLEEQLLLVIQASYEARSNATIYLTQLRYREGVVVGSIQRHLKARHEV
jgi:hypothetical protein